MPVKRVQDLDPITAPLVSTDLAHVVTEGLAGKEDHKATMAEMAQAIARPWNTEYDPLHTYGLYDQTFYQGIPYRSLLANNSNHTPDVSPTYWEVTGGGSGGGGVNLIKNPVQKATAASWSKGSGSFVAAPSWSTTKNLYAGGALLLEFTAGAKTVNDYFDADFVEIMESMTGLSWKIRATMFIDSGAMFVADDIAVNYFDGVTEVPINYVPISVLNNKIVFEAAMIPTNVIGSASKLRFRAKLGSTTCVGNLRIADISVAPQVFISIPRRSDWIGYIPTFQGLGTVSNVQAEYALDSGDLIGQVKVTAGNVSATEFRCDLPPGFTSRSTIPTIQIAGELLRGTANAGAYYVLIEPSKNYLTFGVHSSGTAALTKMTGTGGLANNDVLSFKFRIPCAQLSANINIAGLSDPMYLSNSESVANTNGVVGKSSYAIEGAAMLSHTAATYFDMTLPRPIQPDEDVKIQVRSIVDKTWLNAESFGVPSLNINNFTNLIINVNTPADSRRAPIQINKISSGVIRVLFEQGLVGVASGSLVARTWANVIGAADGVDRWRVKIGRNNASEIPRKVRARYSNSDAAAINVPINFSNKIEDTHGAVTTGAGVWKFTAPVQGYYIPMAKMNVNVGHTIELTKRGSTITPNHIISLAFSAAVNYGIPFNEPIWLEAGDWIQIIDSTGTAYASADSVIDIIGPL